MLSLINQVLTNIVLLQEGPADTVAYFIAGYVVIFGSIGLYLLSMYLRNRNLQADLALLAELEDEAEPEAVEDLKTEE